jgi:hypothetical protein
MKTVSKWFGYLDKPERTPELMRRAFTMLRSGRPGPDSRRKKTSFAHPTMESPQKSFARDEPEYLCLAREGIKTLAATSRPIASV